MFHPRENPPAYVLLPLQTFAPCGDSVGQTIGFCRLSSFPGLARRDRPRTAMVCPTRLPSVRLRLRRYVGQDGILRPIGNRPGRRPGGMATRKASASCQLRRPAGTLQAPEVGSTTRRRLTACPTEGQSRSQYREGSCNGVPLATQASGVGRACANANRPSPTRPQVANLSHKIAANGEGLRE
jgi:hypothetical protein